MDKLQKFKNLELETEIPAKSAAWRIYGKGMEHFGDKKKAAMIPVSEPADDEILVRSDAVGLCFSDTKIIKFGSDHPRITGRDLKKYPVIPGHEVALTVIKVGKNRLKDYRPGERYIIQADAYYKGKSIAYGYVLPGGLTQYGIIGKEILDGDDGSYLIPIKKTDKSYAETALVEPWACVVASYRIVHRDGIKNGGNLLVIGNGKPGGGWKFKKLLKKRTPKRAVFMGVEKTLQEDICGFMKRGSCETVTAGGPSPDALEKSVSAHTDGRGFDDIIILGDADDETIAAAGESMCEYGILNYLASTDAPQVAAIDVGKVHYDRISFIGGTSADVNAPYTENLDYQMHGDSVILLGAGGPMGQMHVQLVFDNPKGPKTVIATDIAENRLEVLREKFEPLARKKGIGFHVINPNDFSSQKEAREKILELNGGKLFDYVVCLAAIPAVIEDASSYLGNRAILNIFAGVSRGTIAHLDIKKTVTNSVRWIGSSGSKLEDMEYTLRKVEKNELDTNSAVAGVAGMNDVWKGIDAVRTGSFPGKIVVYPHIPKLDLISLKELKEKHPKIGALLSNNGGWTKAAEEELLREFLEE